MYSSIKFLAAISNIQNKAPERLLLDPQCLNLRDNSNCIFINFRTAEICVVKEGEGNVKDVPIISLVCYCGAIDVLKYYIENMYSYDEDISNPLVDSHGRTPFDFAKIGNQNYILRYLLEETQLPYASSFRCGHNIFYQFQPQNPKNSGFEGKKITRTKPKSPKWFKSVNWNLKS